ncbi:hypothetical protein EYF80_011295 [Liparis tanakae]|uniref:Uncharacterized protein n=1 Tax=Liparis tanakae TaxID=230148 RepID=A0A4Z2IMS2_9TELE|nr:hypothetical protein EYF80_011295 [Liparis tanakae]
MSYVTSTSSPSLGLGAPHLDSTTSPSVSPYAWDRAQSRKITHKSDSSQRKRGPTASRVLVSMSHLFVPILRDTDLFQGSKGVSAYSTLPGFTCQQAGDYRW